MVQTPKYGHFWWKLFPGDQDDQGIHVGDAGWVTGSLWDEDRAPRKPLHDEPFVDWSMIAKRNWFLSATLCIIHLSSILLWIHVLSFVLKGLVLLQPLKKKVWHGVTTFEKLTNLDGNRFKMSQRCLNPGLSPPKKMWLSVPKDLWPTGIQIIPPSCVRLDLSLENAGDGWWIGSHVYRK